MTSVGGFLTMDILSADIIVFRDAFDRVPRLSRMTEFFLRNSTIDTNFIGCCILLCKERDGVLPSFKCFK